MKNAEVISISGDLLSGIPSEPESQLNFDSSIVHSSSRISRNDCRDDTKRNIPSKQNKDSNDALKIKMMAQNQLDLD